MKQQLQRKQIFLKINKNMFIFGVKKALSLGLGGGHGPPAPPPLDPPLFAARVTLLFGLHDVTDLGRNEKNVKAGGT